MDIQIDPALLAEDNYEDDMDAEGEIVDEDIVLVPVQQVRNLMLIFC